MFIRVAVAILACVLTIWAIQAFAKPAPWYLWESRVDGHRLCHQFDPGDGWVRVSGPFKDARCRLAVVPPKGSKGQ